MSYVTTYFTSGVHEKEHCTTILHFLHITYTVVFNAPPSHVFLLIYIYIYKLHNITVLIAVIW